VAVIRLCLQITAKNGPNSTENGKRKIEYSEVESSDQTVVTLTVDESSSLDVGNQPNVIIIYALLTGSLAGFLGGLVGAEGPALIFFFLIFKYDKSIVRTVGMITAITNITGRIIMYLFTDPPEDWPVGGTSNNNSTNSTELDTTPKNDIASNSELQRIGWFILEDWPVYLALIGTSVVGAFIGSKLYKKVTQGRFDNILTGLLVVCGLAMTAKPVVMFFV